MAAPNRVDPAVRQLRAGDGQPRTRMATGHRIGASPLALAALCMAAARYGF